MLPFLRKRSNPFRSLGWKLTLSYTLVTAGALLVVELAGLVILQALLSSPAFPRLVVHSMQDSIGGAFRPFLERPEPDIAGLNVWLGQTFSPQTGYALNTGGGEGVELSDTSFGGDGRLAILALDGTLLTSQPIIKGLETGDPMDASAMPGLAEVLPRAIAGEEDIDRLYTRTPSGDLTFAVPIYDQTGTRRIAILAFTSTISPWSGPDFEALLELIGSSLLVFTIAAAAVGTVFGFFTARALTARLHKVTQAADLWSRGDFNAYVHDKSGDELGQMARRLNQMAEQLHTLVQARQELATLEERNRLARDLHDSVKQQVFAASMQVGAARELLEKDPASAQTHLAAAEELSRQAQQELAVLIRELRPAALEGKGLVKALQSQAAEWSQQNGLQVELRVQGERALPLAIEQALFRIAQEALSNVARHSAATRAELHLAIENSQITFTIHDNGHGFDPHAAPAHGLGLNSMQERVQALGGVLDVATGPEGTRVTLNIPL